MLCLFLGHLGRAHLEELARRQADTSRLAEHLYLQQPRIDRLAQVTDGLQQRIRPPDLVRRLLQSSLRAVDASVAIVNVLLHVAHVVVIEAMFLFLRSWQSVVFDLEVLRVEFGARTQILFGVCEQVVGACAGEVGAADLRRCQGQIGSFACYGTRELVAHELFEEFALFVGHDDGCLVGWWKPKWCVTPWDGSRLVRRLTEKSATS